MPLKAPVITLLTVATTLGTSGDTSIRDTDLQLVTIGVSDSVNWGMSIVRGTCKPIQLDCL
jgi:hypothetical protein